MARPREFDEEQVLDLAMEAFWRHGYEATSVSDLVEATGLAKGSLYKAFGDKHSLYLRVLQRYLEGGYRHARRTLFDAPDAMAGIQGWLDNAVGMAVCDLRKGCFGVNCTIESAPHDDAVRELLASNQERLDSLLEEVIARGVERGELRAGLDPHVAALFVSTVVSGLQVAGKAGASKQDARAQAVLALSALR